MSFPEIKKELLDDKELPRVVLAGQSIPIPHLVAKRILKFSGKALGIKISKDVNEEQMERIYQAVWIGVTQALPDLSYDDFMDQPVVFDELLLALPVIAKQAGMDVTVKGGDVVAGEASAEPKIEAIS